MNTKSNSKLRNFLCSVIAVFVFTLANLSFLHFSKESYTVYASSSSDNQIEISNSNFNKDSDNTFPIKNITGFTAYNGDKEATNSNPNCGVIDLTDDDYSTRFAIAKEGRTSLDNYVLMLSSTASGVNYGYRTKSAISMNANSNYMITVDVFNATDAGIGNLSLYNDSEVFAKIDNINSYNTWTTYHLFVKTGEESLSLKLGLNVTGNGTVLFDNISCFELNNNELTQNIQTQENAGIKYAYQDEVVYSHIVDTFTVDNDGFAGTSERKTIKNTNFDADKNGTDYTTHSIVNDFDGTNLKAFLIKNSKSTFVEYTIEDLIDFEQSSIYKVSVKAKASNMSGSAYLQLVENNVDSDKATNSDKLTISSNTSSTINNNYQTYTFYVKGNPTKAVSYNLLIGLGSSDSNAVGNLYISQIQISKVKSSDVASTSSSITVLDLTSDYSLSSNSLYVNNGKFDSFTIDDVDTPFPATPNNWTVTSGNGNQTYGVVNTLNSNFDLLDNDIVYPYSNEENQNILMLYNSTSDSLIYTSESKSLDANSYNRFELDVQSVLDDVTISIIAKKDNKEFVIASKSIETGSKIWKTLTFYIKTGTQPIDVYVKINLTSSSKAYAFIDNVKFNYPSMREDEFNSASKGMLTAKVDLNDLFNSNLFTGEENSNGNFEIIDLSSANYSTLVGEENVENFIKNTISNNKLIKVQNLDDTDYNITSNVAFKLSSGTKYKITIDAFSLGIRTDVLDADLDNLGFGIKLTEFENYFVAKQSNGEWTTYTLYINPTSDTTAYLDLSLGNEDLACAGTVYFANINLIELTDDEDFDSIVENSSTIILKNIEEETDEDDSTEDEEKSDSKFSIDKETLLYVIPSVIFAIAILITVVAVFVRKIKWKKPSHKTKNAYDRNKTVSKQYYERKATMVREEKLRDLNKQLENLNNDRATYEEQYKADMSSLRKMKISRASQSDITKLEKEMKKNQKTASTIGVSISKIKREIEYVQTDLYFNALVKQLQVRGVDDDTETK